MNKTKTSAIVLAVFALLLALGLSACQPKRRVKSPTEKHYELKGTVVSVEKDQRLATIAHDDIADYMPSMTMPFIIENDADLQILAPGDQIVATLVVDGATSFLEDLTITKESTDTTSATSGEVVGPKPGDEVPNYRLINQDNKVIRIGDYKGKALLLTFVYTRCPDPNQCTLMSNNFATIDKRLREQPELYEKTHLLSISFDPDYDTPKVLRSYGAAYTGKYSDETFAHWEFASGSADEVKGIAQFFGMRYYQSDSGEQQVIHSLRTAVIGPDGKIVKVYRGNEWKPEEVLKDLRAAVGGAKIAADERK